MQIKPVKSTADIQEGMIVIVGDEKDYEAYKAILVKNVPGVEVVLDRRQNIYFNIQRYLDGTSWVKDVGVVVTEPQ